MARSSAPSRRPRRAARWRTTASTPPASPARLAAPPPVPVLVPPVLVPPVPPAARRAPCWLAAAPPLPVAARALTSRARRPAPTLGLSRILFEACQVCRRRRRPAPRPAAGRGHRGCRKEALRWAGRPFARLEMAPPHLRRQWQRQQRQRQQRQRQQRQRRPVHQRQHGQVKSAKQRKKCKKHRKWAKPGRRPTGGPASPPLVAARPTGGPSRWQRWELRLKLRTHRPQLSTPSAWQLGRRPPPSECCHERTSVCGDGRPTIWPRPSLAAPCVARVEPRRPWRIR